MLKKKAAITNWQHARLAFGVRVMGWLEDVKLEDVKVGMKLRMSTRKLSDGFLVITFKPSSSR